VKSLNIRPESVAEKKAVIKKLRAELQIWAGLEHRNVLNLLGTVTNSKLLGMVSMVCPWMDNGDLDDYQKKHPFMNEKMRFQILKDIAEGLNYLHDNTRSIVHGDLWSRNILFDGEGTARIGDFGLSKVAQRTSKSTHSTTVDPGMIYYRPPELYIHGSHQKPSKCSDIYSFGSIIYQVVSGKAPYEDIQENIWTYINRNAKWHWPKRHDHIDKIHWTLIQKCWERQPEHRPSTRDVLKIISQRYESIHGENKPLTVEPIPSPPEPSSTSIHLSNLPPGATHFELIDFIHRHHGARSGQTTQTKVESSPANPLCNLCPKFLFIWGGSACAIFDEGYTHARDRSIQDCSKQRWLPESPGSPTIVCREWTELEDFGRGSGMHVRWKDSPEPRTGLPRSLCPDCLSYIPELVPFLKRRAFIMRYPDHPDLVRHYCFSAFMTDV